MVMSKEEELEFIIRILEYLTKNAGIPERVVTNYDMTMIIVSLTKNVNFRS
jgi:hypothetical protein